MKIERIVVGVDGSDNSHTALAWAADLARALDAEVVAVPRGNTIHDANSADTRHLFDTDWCAVLDDPTVRSTRLLRDGNPVSVLLSAAEEFDAGLVVVGSRGLGGYPELLLGSTSTQVAQRCNRPVVIIPAGFAESSQ
ncbi:MAG: universal stress protein [Acidimicrobiales bacterium]